MSTYAPDQIPAGSYDNSAVSIVVSNKSASDSRRGMFFDDEFVVASPIHFHDMGNGQFVGVFSERWHTVTASSSDPNLFDSHVADTSPSWVAFDGTNGHHGSISGQYGNTPPTNVSYDSRIVVGACSRANSYLYMLQSYTKDEKTFGVVSHFHINPVTRQVNLMGEESFPNIVVGEEDEEETVIFDRGITYSSLYLNVAGRDSLGRIYMARKNWGSVAKRNDPIEYQSDKGWTQEPSRIVPLKDSDGDLISVGPVSFAEYRGRTWVSVVQSGEAGAVSARIYMSRGLWDAWTPKGSPYGLGVMGESYLGGTVYLQPALRINAARFDDFSVTGVPVVYAVKRVAELPEGEPPPDGEPIVAEGMDIFWELHPVNS